MCPPDMDTQTTEIMTEINQLLADWHNWSSKTQVVSYPGKCAMFSQSQSPRHWDTASDIDDSHIQQSTMQAIDFAVLGDAKGQGGLVEPQRTAILVKARNLATCHVFTSPRLPQCQIERAKITNEALQALERKLRISGVL